MANKTLEFRWHSGQTITVDIVSAAGVRLQAGLAATELTYGKTRYQVTYTEDEIGHVTLHIIIDGQYLSPCYDYILVETEDVQYPVADIAMSLLWTEERVATLIEWIDSGCGIETGAGALSTTIYTKDSSGLPLDGAEVWITTDSAGTNVVAGTLCSDAAGLTTFMLDAGSYYVWRQLAGYDFSNPQIIAVAS